MIWIRLIDFIYFFLNPVHHAAWYRAWFPTPSTESRTFAKQHNTFSVVLHVSCSCSLFVVFAVSCNCLCSLRWIVSKLCGGCLQGKSSEPRSIVLWSSKLTIRAQPPTFGMIGIAANLARKRSGVTNSQSSKTSKIRSVRTFVPNPSHGKRRLSVWNCAAGHLRGNLLRASFHASIAWLWPRAFIGRKPQWDTSAQENVLACSRSCSPTSCRRFQNFATQTAIRRCLQHGMFSTQAEEASMI